MADTSPEFRWSLYWLLMIIGLGMVTGRILAVNSVDRIGLENDRVQKEVEARAKQLTQAGADVDRRVLEAEAREKLRLQRPFLSANDRSRWATVRSLVEHGTYAIDDVVVQPGWDTIDMVKHRGADGQEHLYSSKPPLLATLMAGEYWLIHRLTGLSLGAHPYEVGRLMILSIHLPVLLFYFVSVAKLIDRFGNSDWARVTALAMTVFGTFLTTFAVSINNHLLAAASVAVATWLLVRIWTDRVRDKRYFAGAGLAAAFAFANELPALSFLALFAAAIGWQAPRQTLLAFLPAAACVVGAAQGTNFLAHQSWREPYMHRSATDPTDNWYVYTYIKDGKERESYWMHPVGIDQGEASAGTYAWHATFGHHGIFSLTPAWVLSVAGCGIMLRKPGMRYLGASILLLSAVCLTFYLMRPQIDRNYGGMTSGLRWMFWFAPLWLVSMVPALDALSRRWEGRAAALTLIAFSVLSASYPTWNPWVHPWITNLLLHWKWIQF